MALKPRTILVGVVGIGVWAIATKVFFDWRAENQRDAKVMAERAERAKPKPPEPPKFGPGKGEFETYFTEPHELSNKAELTRRLALRPKQLEPTTAPGIAPGVTEDSYELPKQIYRIYVPENYSPAVAHGVIYYLGYKDTTAIPPVWKATLDEKHLIFISAKICVRPEWQAAAVALDAVHNLKKQYTIDEKRIYLFEFPDRPGLVGLQMGFGLPDVFTGFVHIDRLQYFRNVQVPQTRQMYPALLGQPPADLLAASKTMPHAFVLQDNYFVAPGSPDRRPLFHTALERDGFTRLLFIDIADQEELHYPNLHGTWLAQTLEFLEKV